MAIRPITELLAERRWLRVADEEWADPLDPSWAARFGGRWNPPHSFPTLYLNEDLATAQAQISKLLAGQPVEPEDLDPPYVLVVVALPRRQRVADAATDDGLRGLGLPTSYPNDEAGNEIGRDACQPIGTAVHEAGLRGLHCRSAATADGSGRELAWFPARSTSRATQVGAAMPFASWWAAVGSAWFACFARPGNSDELVKAD